MTMRPEDVKETRFREAWRGYDEDEVDDFMSRVGHALQVLTGERDEARARADELARDAEEVLENERLLRRTLLTAERTAEETVQRAEQEAERILSEARAEAERLRIEAQDRARYELQQAADAADRIRQALREFRSLRDEYRSRVHEVVREQLAAIDRVGEIPDLPEPMTSFEDLDVPRGGGADVALGDGGATGVPPDQLEPPSVLSLNDPDAPPPGADGHGAGDTGRAAEQTAGDHHVGSSGGRSDSPV